jgi:hypothetical protein
MCHSNVQIEFGEWVNFITGQNGSKRFSLSLIRISVCSDLGLLNSSIIAINRMCEFYLF